MSLEIHLNVNISESGEYRFDLDPHPDRSLPAPTDHDVVLVLRQGTSVISPGLSAQIPGLISSI